ncbi:CAP domain-containing protein [Tessaracoccus sp. MC1756]|uniref:CAP domain-containing protein n=1 Tax=Tessaracoccus sp. MC1756 TaxID=2760311 RepID=UPI0016008F4A|nr:CAP domain-containing protein [Tessaracoccus sp. MC1756]MBB1509945.1 CAP domain-containing protein [Tessaracoccus sp. MC1756]
MGLQSSQATTAIDNSNIESVRAAYQQQLKPALAVQQDWTGNLDTCAAGAPSAAAQKATLDAVNYFRAMGGLAAVKFDAALSAKAQQAALIMSANKRLDHYPTDSWRCISAQGKEAAGRSNIALGAVRSGSGAGAIALYMSEPGASNTAVGHRRWVMRPHTTTMGSGSTTNSNALWVISTPNDNRSNPDPAWIPWPTAGYFPTQIQPNGRWSLTGNSSTKFDSAKVSVTGPNGPVQVTKQPLVGGMGNPTLVFELGLLPKPVGSAVHTYTVTVSGIVRNGVTVSHSYGVKLFDADAPAAGQPAPASPRPTTPAPTQTIWVTTGNRTSPSQTPTPPKPTAGGFVRSAPYTLPGIHRNVNGRDWQTRCEPYSQTERCRTDIWAAIVVKEGGRFVQKEGWAFNNLTYLPLMSRAEWGTNPIAMHNMNGFESGGRRWKTECDTAQTGRGACRSYTFTTVFRATTTTSGLVVKQSGSWVFNNLVLFR